MIVHRLNPVLLDLGFLQIRYYSLAYIIGLVIGFYIIYHLVQKKGIRLSREDVLDYMTYLAVGLIAGGRLFYFVFYDARALLNDPLELFRLWHGGMSFHGGLIGSVAAGYIFCRKKKVSFWRMADITVVPLGIGLALGRIGNFINGELYGRPWDGFLCIDYTQNENLDYLPKLCRYPSQLAEAMKNIAIFGALWWLKDKRLPAGFLFSAFVALYGLFRFFIEFIRQPDPQIGLVFNFLTMGQVLSGVMALLGTAGMLALSRKGYK